MAATKSTKAKAKRVTAARAAVATRPWDDTLKDNGYTAARIAQLEHEGMEEMIEMDLKAIRELAGKTQVEVGVLMEMTQSEVSRLEKRDDYRLSTIRKLVEALGGELSVIATFGDRSVRLRAVA